MAFTFVIQGAQQFRTWQVLRLQGSSNALQVDGNNDNGADDRNDDSFQSAQTAVTTSSAATTSISVTSESNLLVPGKLYNDIVKLKECYVAIIHSIDPHATTSSFFIARGKP